MAPEAVRGRPYLRALRKEVTHMQLSPELEFILAVAGAVLALIAVYGAYKRLPGS